MRKPQRPDDPTPENVERYLAEAEVYDRLRALRDRFAMAALPYVLNEYGENSTATFCYQIADAMLEEREK